MSVSMRYGSSGFAQSNGLRLDLLWTNDDPSSNFAAQTVALDLSGYTHFMVIPIFSKSTQNLCPPVMSPAEDGITIGMVCGSGSGDHVGSRTCYYDSTQGIVFAGGNYSGSANNQYCIPMYIYGIRSSGGVTVAGWSSGGGGGGVTSVNGMTGVVVLSAADVNALPSTTSIIATDDGNGNVTLTLG